MSKQYYCSSCGIQLKAYPKAVPGKGYIVNLVDPHECEGYAIAGIEEGQKTVLEIINGLKTIAPTTADSEIRSEKANLIIGKDLRDERDKRTTSAPSNLLNHVEKMEPE